MAHFAELDDTGKVLRVVVCDTLAQCQTLFGGRWVETRKGQPGYAGIGFTYRAATGTFTPKKPYPSWSLNPEKTDWVPPTAPPQGIDLTKLKWVEATKEWVLNG